MLENKFKQNLVNEIKNNFPGSFVFHLDPSEMQGIPDLLVLHKNRWAALEGKKNKDASKRPNQEYYVEKLNNIGFARFIYPENKKEVLDELQTYFQ